MFAMIVEDAFEIKGRGTVLSGHYDSERYEISVNTRLYDMSGEEYVVLGIAMFRRAPDAYADSRNYPADLILKSLRNHDKNYFVGKLLTTQYDIMPLYPEDPLCPALADSVYRKEADNAGNYALISFEKLMQNEISVKNITENGKIVRLIYRGWMIQPEQYGLLYNRLAARGVFLVNTPEQYRRCHCLPEWYDLISDITIKSVWTDDLSDDVLRQMLIRFGSSPVIVKDYVKSRKHEWFDACYIRDASDARSAMRVIHNFIEHQGDSLTGGIVLRQYEKLVPAGTHPESGMPISEEYRAFFFAGQLLCVCAYWSEAGQKNITLSKEETSRIKLLPQRIDSNFFTADFGRKSDGTLCVMELGDGQVSGLQGLKEDFFYNRLKAVCNSVEYNSESREDF